MGLDTSSHPFDRDLLKTRIVPFLLAGEPIDDLIDRAVAVELASYRVNQWSLAVTDFHNALFNDQYEIAKTTKSAPPAERKPGFFARLFGGKGAGGVREEPPRIVPGLPGFDVDLHVWGRPFFVDGDAPEEIARGVDRYMAAAEGGNDAVDAVVKDMLASLERKRQVRPEGVADAVWETVARAPSLLEVEPKGGPPSVSVEAAKANARRRVGIWREVMAARDPNAEISFGSDGDDDEPMTVADAQMSLPHDIVGFMSSLSHGWMSRGYGFASQLIERVGAKSDVFETPEEPFSELVALAPAMREAFFDTIPGNYDLGGYVRPERVGELIEVLDAHREAMIRVFEDDPRREIAPYHLEQMSADWRKLRETAAYAQVKGWGYLEGAEIYSGFLGQMN